MPQNFDVIIGSGIGSGIGGSVAPAMLARYGKGGLLARATPLLAGRFTACRAKDFILILAPHFTAGWLTPIG